MSTLLPVVLFGAVFIVGAVLSRRDLIPRNTEREGIFDNAYAWWPVGVGIILFFGGGDLENRDADGPLAGILVLCGLVLMLYGIYAVIASPRWMWPAWRHEMEQRDQQKSAEKSAGRS